MKSSKGILILLLIVSICSCTTRESFLDYVLSWDGISPRISVELTYSAEKDSTVFIFGDPSFGGQKDIFKVIQNIRTVAPEVVKIDEEDRRITVYHKGAKEHKLTYEIVGSLPFDSPTKSSQSELFRPVITKGVMTLANKQFALEITDESNPLVSFRWKDYPKNSSYFNSVSPSQTDPAKKIFEHYDNLSEVVMFMMGTNIVVQRYHIMGIPYYAVTTIEDRNNNDLQSSISPFFESYFPSIHRFWDDTDFPFYFISITALQNNLGDIGGGGFGIKNGFVMKLGRVFGSWERYVTAHETAHSWTGIKIALGSGSFDHQWFGEGFNDYTALINLVNSKIYDQEEFLEYLNEESLRQHYESEIKGAHNDSIAAKYWTDYANYGKLPYRRGLIYAFYLDNQIRIASEGKFTLRNMLLDLYELRKGKMKGENLTLEDLITAGGTYLDENELADQIERYMIAGEPIDFAQASLIPEFTIDIQDNIPRVSLASGANLADLYRW
jgi:predicted metalloprotease with PDZ domain